MHVTTPGAFVSALDYRGIFDGFGGSPRSDEIEQLRKALTAGSAQNNPGIAAGEGFPLRVESLEATLKNTTFEMDEIKLFKAIPKLPATNTVEEFNRLVSYSEGGVGEQYNQGWMSEGELPAEEDSTYERAYAFIKFLGITRRVSHPMTAVRAAHGNVIAQQTMDGTMGLLKKLEPSLFFGDSSLIPEQFDGLEKLIVDGSGPVVDLRGQVLTEQNMNDFMLQIRDNYGKATDVYLGTGPFADIANQVYDRQRFEAAPAPGVLGTQIKAFQGQHGRVTLNDSVFIQPSGVAPSSGNGDSTKRPNTPTISSQPSGTGSGSQFTGSFAGGTYIYQICAVNRFGRSAPVTTSSVAPSSGENVVMTVADAGGGTSTQYYEVYRTEAGGAASTAKLILKVARSGSSQVITDTNSDLPGTSKGFVLMQNMQSFSWAQLLPMTRIPLATIDTSIRWAQVLYGAIKMYTPKKNLLIKNIGRAS